MRPSSLIATVGECIFTKEVTATTRSARIRRGPVRCETASDVPHCTTNAGSDRLKWLAAEKRVGLAWWSIANRSGTIGKTIIHERVLKAPQTFSTNRLTFTVPTADDIEAIFCRYASDLEVTKYLGWPCHRFIADTTEFVAFSQTQWQTSPAGPYLIWARSTGQLLGSTGLSCEKLNQAMTGYVLAKDAWGNGYATEALNAMVQVAQQLGLARIFGLCHPDHCDSRRVLEKGGFTIDPSWSGKLEFPNFARGILQEATCYERVFLN